MSTKLRNELGQPEFRSPDCADDWKTSEDTDTRDSGLGVHAADLPSDGLPSGRRIVFTIYWREEQRWEGTDYILAIA